MSNNLLWGAEALLMARFRTLNPTNFWGYDFTDFVFRSTPVDGYQLLGGANNTQDIAGGAVKCDNPGANTFAGATREGIALVSLRTKAWVLGGLIQCEGTVGADATEVRALMIGDQTGAALAHIVGVGLFQVGSSTHFSFACRGDSVHYAASSIAYDNNLHFVSIWCDFHAITPTVFGSIDGEPPVTVTTDLTQLPDGAVSDFHGVYNNNGTAYIDAAGVWFER